MGIKTIKELEADLNNPRWRNQSMIRIQTLKDVLGLMKELEKLTSYYEMWKELKARITG